MEAGYPLLQHEEYITGEDCGEKYDLGVLTYLGIPLQQVIYHFFVYHKYKGTNVFNSRLIIIFIYFIITVICGFVMLVMYG